MKTSTELTPQERREVQAIIKDPRNNLNRTKELQKEKRNLIHEFGIQDGLKAFLKKYSY